MPHDRSHPPSRMRALVQESRSGGGRPIQELLEDARAIADPSFAAEALFQLAGHPRLPPAEAGRVLGESLHFLNKVERGWRQAEVADQMARKAPKLRSDDASAPHVERFLDGLTDTVLRLPPGEALSNALRGLAKSVPAGRRGELVAKALSNGSAALQDAKEVADAGPKSRKAILASPDTALRARLLAHLHVREGAGTLRDALHEARQVPDQDRLEVLRGIVASLAAPADLDAVHADPIGGDEERARVLSALAARADKLGDRERALAWFAEAAQHAAKIRDPKARAAVRSNLAQGLERAGSAEKAEDLAAQASQDKELASAAAAAARPPPTEKAEKGAKGTAAETPSAKPGEGAAPVRSDPEPPRSPPKAKATGGRHVLALVDTYEGGLSEVHLRAVARAAPLCDAFGLDLALVGFPTDNLGALLKQAMAETNIADGGRHIQDLVAGGHVHLVHATHRQAPDLSGLGLAVATTPEPDQHRMRDFPGCLAAARLAGAARLVVLMGLGRKGLPPTFLKAAPVHLELTGRNVHLETATAMGIIAERMRQLPTL